MHDSRYEIYTKYTNGLPFVLNENLTRSPTELSRVTNWHENLEIQLCNEGEGEVFIDGERHRFQPNELAVVNSNALHHTGSNTSVTYSCLIIDTDFCRSVGIEPSLVKFKPLLRDDYASNLFKKIAALAKSDAPYRLAKLNISLIELLVCLAERHGSTTETEQNGRRDVVKAAILFIRENYSIRFTIADVAKAVSFDKFALCREFKRLTGQTIIQNANAFRCVKAVELLGQGLTVTETAELCGFDNLSYFTKTFKLYVGALPINLRRLPSI